MSLDVSLSDNETLVDGQSNKYNDKVLELSGGGAGGRIGEDQVEERQRGFRSFWTSTISKRYVVFYEGKYVERVDSWRYVEVNRNILDEEAPFLWIS